MNVFGSGSLIGLVVLLTCSVRAEAPPPPRPSEIPRRAPSKAAPDIPVLDETLCGTPGLQGEPLPPIAENGDCGVPAPARIDSIAGVTLEPPAIIACATARALLSWLEKTATPSFSAQGATLRTLTVADAYSCRNRNRAASGKLSEHARGNAIDIAGFDLNDGRSVTVLEGWNSSDWGPVLRRLRAGGCGPFSTVLGPGSNALHADHFHFDVEPRRSPWCE